MSGKIRNLLDQLKAGFQTIYHDRLKGLYLYGSYARGDQDGASDVDILVVLDRFDRYGAEVDRTGELCAKLSLKYDVSVSRVFLTEEEWRDRETPFLDNVREEAVPA